MNVLGILGFGQNPAACLLQDGKMTAFVEEERLTRLKGSDGMFPGKSIRWCLQKNKLNLEQIDYIAFGWDANKYPWTIGKSFTKNYLKYRGKSKKAHSVQKNDASSMSLAFETLLEYHPDRVKSKIHHGLRAAGLRGKFPPIEFVNHHMAHAYSTYFCSTFEEAGILTLDGSGEDISTELCIAKGDSVQSVERYPIPHSLGWFYAAVTQYLGFLPYRDEGKLMGLAALGEERSATNKWIEPLSKVLKITADAYEVNPIYTKLGGHYYADRYTDEFVKLMTGVDANVTPIFYGDKVMKDGKLISKYLLDEYIDIAWAAQELLERAAIMLAKKLVNKYGMKNICIAGGVGMNCKMNGEILQKSGCENIFVQPASSDAGTALGAAMVIAQKYGDNIRNPLVNTYYGPSFSNDEIHKLLKNTKVSFKKLSDPSQTAAELLEEGKIISWFQGQMEFGARALGNRSILANPAFPDMKIKVNDEVKYRENWRPFCPSMTAEAKNDYLVNPNEASFMIVAYHLQEEKKKALPAIVHVDGTVRPQAVSNTSNPKFHSLIDNLGKKTGHPVVMNTSFNVRGEPIITEPLDAIRCFYSNGLDALIMEDFLLLKH